MTRVLERVRAVVEGVRSEYAPDLRTAVFEVTAEPDAEGIVLRGATSEPAAAEEMGRRVAVLDAGVRVRDAVERLPAGGERGEVHALVRAATAPMLAGPLVSDPAVSQVVLGHRVLVLRGHGRWLHCRSADGYLGWVHRGYLHRVDEAGGRAWEVGGAGEPCASLGAEVYDGRGEVLARIPWGGRLHLDADGRGVLPTGERGRLEGEVVRGSELAARFPAEGAAVVETAARWIGAPYQWGGVTPAGVDCSGFVQAVFRMHGVELPRDSDQQALRGEPAEPGDDFGALRRGDLLFFAEAPARVSHVALSLGGPRILHAALGNGGVRRNDLLGDTRFEEELRSLLVDVRRPLSPGGGSAARPGGAAG